jgi:hypothetical protein
MKFIVFLLIATIFLEVLFDFVFSRTGKQIYLLVSGKDLSDELFEQRKFAFRLLGACFWIGLYALLYFAFLK